MRTLKICFWSFFSVICIFFMVFGTYRSLLEYIPGVLWITSGNSLILWVTSGSSLLYGSLLAIHLHIILYIISPLLSLFYTLSHFTSSHLSSPYLSSSHLVLPYFTSSNLTSPHLTSLHFILFLLISFFLI